MTNIKKTIARTSATILIVVVFGYGYFRTKDFLEGPVVTISMPYDGQTLTSPLIEVSGKSRNISFLNLDGRKIFTDKDGNWGEKLLLVDGVNIIEVRATDRFKRENVQVLHVVYKADPKNDKA